MSRPLVTVNTLLTQVRERGAVELPGNALITPAAADWLHGARVPVRRLNGAAPVAAGADIYVVGDARDPAVQTVLPALERRHTGVKFLPCHGHLGGLLDAVKEVCAGLAGCARRKGIVLAEDGAIVNCVANKHPKVRAAIALQPSALFGLMRNLGINLLILENGRLSLRQMQATIEEFLNSKGSPHAAVENALAAVRTPSTDSDSTPCACCGTEVQRKVRCHTCARTKCGSET